MRDWKIEVVIYCLEWERLRLGCDLGSLVWDGWDVIVYLSGDVRWVVVCKGLGLEVLKIK